MINPTLVTFAVYIAIMLVIGLLVYKRNNSMEDYFLGGRSLNSFVVALSAEASDMSGWLLMGLPGAAYAGGFNSMWIAVGLAIGTYLNWQFVAKRLRCYTGLVDSITISDYFENRFHDKTHILRLISAVLTLTFFLFYTSSGMVAGAKLFENTFGLSYDVALYIGGFIVIIYTFLGGFFAVSWTDVVQGLLMFCALVLVPVILINSDVIGGVSNLFQKIGTINPELLDSLKVVSYENGKWITEPEAFTFVSIISLLGWGLGYFGQPHILVRFMGIRSAKNIPKAQLIGVTWVAISLVAAVFIGVLGIVVLEQPLGDPETVFMTLVETLFNPWVAGFLLAAILASVMSTIDSQLLVASSALAEDFYKAFFRKNAPDKELMLVSRGSVVVIAVLAIILAKSGGSVLNLVAYAWAGFGATFGPAMLLSLTWKRMTRNGALAGMLTGGITVIIWKQFLSHTGLYEIIPGFILSWIMIMVVSLLDKEPTKEIGKEFKQFNNELHY